MNLRKPCIKRRTSLRKRLYWWSENLVKVWDTPRLEVMSQAGTTSLWACISPVARSWPRLKSCEVTNLSKASNQRRRGAEFQVRKCSLARINSRTTSFTFRSSSRVVDSALNQLAALYKDVAQWSISSTLKRKSHRKEGSIRGRLVIVKEKACFCLRSRLTSQTWSSIRSPSRRSLCLKKQAQINRWISLLAIVS